jgi:RsiW-degrading membrane proteinase PrsW (M82 family)
MSYQIPPGQYPVYALPQQHRPAAVAPAWAAAPRPAVSGLARGLGIAGTVVAGIALLLALALFGAAFGPVGLGVDFLVALIPLTLVLLIVRWIDRWEPEPFAARLFALLWGAGVSVVAAFLVEVGFGVFDHYVIGFTHDSVVAASVQAPLAEEGMKGLGVLLIFLVMRKTFDGPVDGIVYASTIAAGFAFVENIEYFAGALQHHGGEGLAVVFFQRGLLTPFAHLVFTSCTGAALGFATLTRSRWSALWLFPLGLLAAMTLHGLFNLVLSLPGDGGGFFVVYALIEVPIFAIIVVLVVLARRHEARMTRRALSDYAAAGWFTPQEVTALATGAGRAYARRWATGAGRSGPMKAYIRDATKLAQTRQRIITGRLVAESQADERMLLNSILADRAALASGIG